MQWVKLRGKDEILIKQINRKQNELKMWLCDVKTGQANLLYSEK